MNEVQYTVLLDKLVGIQSGIKDLHPLFEDLYPVAIVEDNCFHIFDADENTMGYRYVKSEPCTFAIPAGVRAAFPLDSYEDRMAAVVTPDVFDAKSGYATILHEFVHCAQGTDCESELKCGLAIAREYQKQNDYMWEINHPFPYGSHTFANLYAQYMEALAHQEYERSVDLRSRLSDILCHNDYEYLIWQEWKEGFARFLENRIRSILGICENHYGFDAPYSRISFYESGSRYISLIMKSHMDNRLGIKDLFFEMNKELK